MLRLSQIACLLGVLAWGQGCGQDDKDDGPKVFDRVYTVKNDQGLTITSSAVSGTGVLAFNAAIAPAAKESRNLSFQASLEVGGSIELVTFANAQLEQGLNVRLERSAENVNMTLQGEEGSKVIPLDLADPSASFLFSVDVHNRENDSLSHVLAWINSEEAPAEESAYLLNDEGFQAGQETSLGLRVTKAKVENLKLGEAKSELE